MKQCRTCRALKPLSEYHRTPTKAGTCNQCKVCRCAEQRNRYLHGNAEVQARKGNLRKKYGLTLEQYAVMLESQNGVCAICEGASARRLDVDHCHKTGRIRGLLCHSCNSMLGHGRDLPERLEAGAQYLRKVGT